MKQEIDNLKETYRKCINTRSIKEKYPDIELVLSLKTMSEKGINFIDKCSKIIEKESDEWTFVFRDYYESLRMLIEAYLLLEGFEADNHQCKNALICFKTPELALNWEFLETARLKRNAINYRGNFLKYSDWLMLKLNFDLHLKALNKAINNRLQS